MSKSRTPAYRVEMNTYPVYTSHMGYDYKRHGKPSDNSLKALVEDLESSAMPGGVNEHLGQMKVNEARIVKQANGDIVAEYNN